MKILFAGTLLMCLLTGPGVSGREPIAGKEPQMAAAPDGTVALAYGSDTKIYVAVSKDRGQTFSAPVLVAEPKVLQLNRHRGPRVAVAGNALVVNAVADGDLMSWRSVDGGKTWSKGVRVDSVPTAAREGLHTLASDGHGNLFAAWLDLRKAGTQLYGAWSRDGGATWQRDQLLYASPDGTICTCCAPATVFDERGGVDLMFRNAVGGSRDLWAMHSSDRETFGKPEKLGTGTWKINACPMDGGGIAREAAKTITAWRREEDIFVDEPGKPEQNLGPGKDVAIAASKDRFYAVWVTGGELEASNGGRPEAIAKDAAFPSVIALPDGGFLAAWESAGTIGLRRLP
jgi:hypothetical protein